MKKNVYILSLAGPTCFIPILWPSAKTYYEQNGKFPERYHWVLPTCEFLTDLEDIKNEIVQNPPDIFGVSLYVWNYEKSLILCRWVKENWPRCIVIAGGPHQYFKHHNDWFEKHWFIDASLPSDVYGEIAITDLLDNLKQDNSINWNTVEQIVYPSKNKKLILKSSKASYKRDFKWGFSAFKEQRLHIKQYVDEYYLKIKFPAIHSKLETTRGCPYECTFCDWGGGVGSKVVLKNLQNVKDDIDELLDLNISSIYMCDANFGINGDRDVSIIQYIADKKKELKKDSFPNIQYAGFAKTNRHFEYLKKILSIEAENGLSYVYKISQQSFSEEILKNVKRTDLRANEHFELSEYLRKKYYYESTVELILGLPGMTLDIWYTEFDKPYEWNILIRAYEWYLLPEAESFEKEYREKFGIQTAKKWFNKEVFTIPGEVVVGGSTFTRDDYKEMLKSYAWYLCFVQTGIYKKSIDQILKKKKIKFGEFLKNFCTICYPRLKQASKESFDYYEKHLSGFVADEVNEISHIINWKNDKGISIASHFLYFQYEFFKNYEILGPIIENWLIGFGAKEKQVEKDSKLIYSEKRLNKIISCGITEINFDRYQNEEELLHDLLKSIWFRYTDLLTAEKKIMLNPFKILREKIKWKQ